MPTFKIMVYDRCSWKVGSILMKQHGFRPRHVQVEHIFPYRVPDYVQYNYVKELQFRWMPAPLFRYLERHFGWHLCITAAA